METALGLFAVAFLVAVNGFFVAAEFSLVGARRTRIAQLASEGSTGARFAQNAINHLDSYIAATQLGITLASLGLGWIGEPAIGHLFEPLLHLFLPEDVVEGVGHTVTVAIAFGLVTMLHIVMGELVPKSIALQRPESTSVLVARPTSWFLAVFRPIIRLMNGVGNGIVHLLGFEPASGHAQVHSPDEIEMLVASSREAGLLEASEELMLRRVFDFSEIPAAEIMQPRVEVDAIPLDIPLPELLELVERSHHSRYPVYDGSIDRVVGVLHTKDLLDTFIRQPTLLANPATQFDLAAVLREPIFVPENISVDKLLESMRKSKTHLAIVIDEYGGMAGVATMEDILEELVGEVQDEFDVETAPILAEGDIAIVDGLVSLTDVIERFGEPEGEDELQSTTIGGYVAERLDRIPTVGDVVAFASYDLHVEAMDGMRVAKVRFRKRPLAAGDVPPDNA